jgi:hypothetical protein
VEQFIKDLEPFAIKKIADYSEKCCEQILRIAEIFLMVIAEETLKRQSEPEDSDAFQSSERVLDHAKTLRSLILMLSTVRIE